MYNYKATVLRVVDGDTFDAIVDLGFNITKKQRFRLKDVDTPETWRPKTEAEREHGKLATAFVKNLIEEKQVILTSVKAAVYSRYEAYVTIEDGSDLGTLIVDNGFQKLEFYTDEL